MLFADALPVLADALLSMYGDSSAVYRTAHGDRLATTVIIRPLVQNEPTTQALIAKDGIAITPARGDLLEIGEFVYSITELQFTESFWILSVRLRAKVA